MRNTKARTRSDEQRTAEPADGTTRGIQKLPEVFPIGEHYSVDLHSKASRVKLRYFKRLSSPIDICYFDPFMQSDNNNCQLLNPTF